MARREVPVAVEANNSRSVAHVLGQGSDREPNKCDPQCQDRLAEDQSIFKLEEVSKTKSWYHVNGAVLIVLDISEI